MTLRVIDNKRVDLTDSEWGLFQEICKSYDAPHRQGKDMFAGLFETDQNGIIIFLRPPTQRYSSMEVYMFLAGVMIHQHLGNACNQVDVLEKKILEIEIARNERISMKESILDKKMQEVEGLLKRGEETISRLEKG